MMLPTISRTLILLAAVWAGLAAHAQTGPSAALYEAEVSVADRSGPARAEAERTALSAVLVKLTGRGDASADEVLSGPTAAVPGLVEQFQYRASNTPGVDRLRVRFDPSAVDSLLRVAGIRSWPKTRPLTVIVLGVDEFGARRVLGAADPGPLGPALRAAAEDRGLPSALPLMDLRDQGAIGAADVWGSFIDRIRAGVGRYRAEAIVFGRADRQADDKWSAEWSLLIGSERADWRAAGLGAEALAERIIGDVADRLAATFVTEAPTTSATAPVFNTGPDLVESRGDGFEIVVTGVGEPRDYGTILSYLSGLDLVERVDVLGLNDGRLTLSLVTGADAGSLRRLLDFGRTLSLGSEGARPEYRLSR